MQKEIFTIMNREGNFWKIKQKDGLVTETIQITDVLPARTSDNKLATILETDQGRAFGRVNIWPQDTIIEIKNWTRGGLE